MKTEFSPSMQAILGVILSTAKRPKIVMEAKTSKRDKKGVGKHRDFFFSPYIP